MTNITNSLVLPPSSETFLHFHISNWSTTFQCKENLRKGSSPPAEAELAGKLVTSNIGANLSLTFYTFSYPGRKGYFRVPQGVCSTEKRKSWMFLALKCRQLGWKDAFHDFLFLFFASAQGYRQIQVGGTWQEDKNIRIEHTQSLRWEKACANVGPWHRFYAALLRNWRYGTADIFSCGSHRCWQHTWIKMPKQTILNASIPSAERKIFAPPAEAGGCHTLCISPTILPDFIC